MPVEATPIAAVASATRDFDGNSRAERYIALSIFVLSFLYLCTFRRYMWVDPDEGIILQGAQRILDGQVLYRDFFSFFTPGSYYFLALIFRIVGDSFLVARTALALIGAGFSPITYLLSRRVCSRQASLLVTGLMTATAVPLRFVVLHNWDSTLLACLGLYCAVRWLESTNPRWAFATGSFVSLTGLFEQSKGAGLLLGLGVGFLIVSCGDQQRKLPGRAQVISAATGLAWPMVATVLYFASQHALGAMLAGWFWPLQHYSSANRVPYGYTNLTDDARHMIFYSGSWGERVLKILVFSPALWLPLLPLFGMAPTLRLLLDFRKKTSSSPDWAYYALISASIAGLLLSIIIVRPDYEHFVFLNPIFFLAFAWLLDGRGPRSALFRKFGLVVGFCLTLSLLVMGSALLIRTRVYNRIISRRGTVATQDKDEVVEYVQSHVVPGERILIYPYESVYYYLTGTYSATRYDYFQPGMHTRQQAEEMISDLSAHPVNVVLYDPLFADHARASWPNTPAIALTSDPAADYILREYRVCTTLRSAAGWRFRFMVRKELICPTN